MSGRLVFLCCSLSALTGFLDFLLLSAGAYALLVLWECSALFSGWDESHWVHMQLALWPCCLLLLGSLLVSAAGCSPCVCQLLQHVPHASSTTARSGSTHLIVVAQNAGSCVADAGSSNALGLKQQRTYHALCSVRSVDGHTCTVCTGANSAVGAVCCHVSTDCAGRMITGVCVSMCAGAGDMPLCVSVHIFEYVRLDWSFMPTVFRTRYQQPQVCVFVCVDTREPAGHAHVPVCVRADVGVCGACASLACRRLKHPSHRRSCCCCFCMTCVQCWSLALGPSIRLQRWVGAVCCNRAAGLPRTICDRQPLRIRHAGLLVMQLHHWMRVQGSDTICSCICWRRLLCGCRHITGALKSHAWKHGPTAGRPTSVYISCIGPLMPEYPYLCLLHPCCLWL